MAKLEIDINKLSPDERLDLIEELWDSLSADPSKIPLTDAQAKELDRRLDEMDRTILLESLAEAGVAPYPNASSTFLKKPIASCSWFRSRTINGW